MFCCSRLSPGLLLTWGEATSLRCCTIDLPLTSTLRPFLLIAPQPQPPCSHSSAPGPLPTELPPPSAWNALLPGCPEVSAPTSASLEAFPDSPRPSPTTSSHSYALSPLPGFMVRFPQSLATICQINIQFVSPLCTIVRGGTDLLLVTAL